MWMEYHTAVSLSKLTVLGDHLDRGYIQLQVSVFSVGSLPNAEGEGPR